MAVACAESVGNLGQLRGSPVAGAVASGFMYRFGPGDRGAGTVEGVTHASHINPL